MLKTQYQLDSVEGVKMHHFVSTTTNSKIQKNENYLRISHNNRNNLPWPKKRFSDFVSRQTAMHSGTYLYFCYCAIITCLTFLIRKPCAAHPIMVCTEKQELSYSRRACLKIPILCFCGTSL